jgi:diketogulonate reductase-like aldo/keto reductase
MSIIESPLSILPQNLYSLGEDPAPLMGFGTFISIVENAAESESDRQEITETTIFEALKAGYRHFDCASNYQNEAWVGNAFRQAFIPVSKGGLGLSREDLWITTKGTHSNLNATLENLGIEYSDLHLEHFPSNFSCREALINSWKLMNELVETGKAKRIGVANYYQPHLERLISVCEEHKLIIPYANEFELHPKLQEHEFVSYCQAKGIHVIAASPLGYANRNFCLEDSQIVAIAEAKLATPAQVVLAWNMKRGVSVIPKSSNADRMRENLAAQQLVAHLDSNDMETIKIIDWNTHFIAASEDCKDRSNQLSW